MDVVGVVHDAIAVEVPGERVVRDHHDIVEEEDRPHYAGVSRRRGGSRPELGSAHRTVIAWLAVFEPLSFATVRLAVYVPGVS